MIVMDMLRTGGYYAIEGTAKAFNDFDGMYNIVKIFMATVKGCDLGGCNLPISKTLMQDCKIFADFSNPRSCLRNTKDLITGEAAGFAQGQTDHNRINLDDGVYAPNITKVASKIFLLAADIGGTMMWLEEVGVLKLAELAKSFATVPCFSLVLELEANPVRGTFAIVGFVLSIADGFRDIVQEGFSWKTTSKIATDALKITVIICKMGKLEVLAVIAQGVGSSISLVRFFAWPPKN
jgi:hypothetical protein